VLRVENQDHFRRAYLRDHPVPHVAALLPRGPRWDAFDAREKRSQAVAWARASRDGAAVRPSLAAACVSLGSRHGGCVEVPPRHRDASPYLFNATFSLEVPGSGAAKRGIVDALLAGTIPVVLRGAAPVAAPGQPLSKTLDAFRAAPFFDPFAQTDLWPWHWPAQELTSLSVSRRDLKERGLRALLDDVDDGAETDRRSSRPNFKPLELGHIDVDAADFWTNRWLSSRSRRTAEESEAFAYAHVEVALKTWVPRRSTTSSSRSCGS
jgi:hypothetical protein